MVDTLKHEMIPTGNTCLCFNHRDDSKFNSINSRRGRIQKPIFTSQRRGRTGSVELRKTNVGWSTSIPSFFVNFLYKLSFLTVLILSLQIEIDRVHFHRVLFCFTCCTCQLKCKLCIFITKFDDLTFEVDFNFFILRAFIAVIWCTTISFHNGIFLDLSGIRSGQSRLYMGSSSANSVRNLFTFLYIRRDKKGESMEIEDRQLSFRRFNR